jgi:hypothetical protein
MEANERLGRSGRERGSGLRLIPLRLPALEALASRNASRIERVAQKSASHLTSLTVGNLDPQRPVRADVGS